MRHEKARHRANGPARPKGGFMGEVRGQWKAYRACLCSELVDIAKPVTGKETAEEEMMRHEYEADVIERMNEFLRINPGFNKLLVVVDLPRVEGGILANENRVCLKGRR